MHLSMLMLTDDHGRYAGAYSPQSGNVQAGLSAHRNLGVGVSLAAACKDAGCTSATVVQWLDARGRKWRIA